MTAYCWQWVGVDEVRSKAAQAGDSLAEGLRLRFMVKF